MTAAEARYDIAVIMPVLNEEKFIGQTLEQIYHQEFPADKVEIVIADGGSTDRTREIAESFKSRFGSLKVLDNPVRRPSSGRNVGVKNSTAPYVVVMDGHTFIPSKHLLRDIIQFFKTTGAACLCRPQPLTPPDINPFQKAVSLCRGSALGHKPGSEIYSDFEGEVDPTSSGAMYARSLFDEIGYFDEQYDACEDVDFNFRIRKAGLRSFLSPRLKVLYYPRATFRGLWRQMMRYGRGRFQFAMKHRQVALVQWLAAAGVMGFAVLLVMAPFSVRTAAIFGAATVAYLWVVALYSVFLALKRKHGACLRYGPIIFPTIHFGLGVGFLLGLYEKVTNKARRGGP
ncbi:MAG TPA: glycosyltransferase [Candidatus Deferrimicrobium sp.]|nr:glycosyltransferase [Candidatus Deferrimicrobium sp.]